MTVPYHLLFKNIVKVGTDSCEDDNILFLSLKRVDCVHLYVSMVVLWYSFNEKRRDEFSLQLVGSDNSDRWDIFTKGVHMFKFFNFFDKGESYRE